MRGLQQKKLMGAAARVGRAERRGAGAVNWRQVLVELEVCMTCKGTGVLEAELHHGRRNSVQQLYGASPIGVDSRLTVCMGCARPEETERTQWVTVGEGVCYESAHGVGTGIERSRDPRIGFRHPRGVSTILRLGS